MVVAQRIEYACELRVRKLDQNLSVRQITFFVQDLSVTQTQDCVHAQTGDVHVTNRQESLHPVGFVLG